MPLKDYQLLIKLGAGSFGIVYRVKYKHSNQLYVIKQIQLSRLDARLRKWSMNQAKLMKEINSPYIVKYVDSFVESSKLFIVMEHCAKGDLCKYIKAQMGKPIKEEVVWRFMIQILLGLYSLHSKKILHRDIKTLNIFLDDNYDIRIGDLGTAKTLSTQFTNTIVGTPYYLSPELCQEKPYNEKTDIWAFGCLVYELCTGKHPFEAQNQAALALKIVMGKFQDIPSFYSNDLKWVVKACLEVDYKRRPSVSYLLERPFVKDNAKKLNLNLSLPTNKPEKPTQPLKKQSIPTTTPIQQIQSLISNVNKKVDEAVKKVQAPQQKAPTPQFNKPKPQLKIIKVSKQKNVNSKEFESLKKAHEASLQKRMKIDEKRGHLPVKPGQKPAGDKNVRNKSKEKVVKMQNLPPVRVVINQKNTPIVAKLSTKQTTKKQQVQVKKQFQKPKQINQTQNLLAQKRKCLPTQQIYEKASIKRQFNYEDCKKLKKQQTLMVKDLDCLDISKKSNNNNNLQQQQQQSLLRNAKKIAFVNYNIQREVDDDLLMAEFGITPEKKEALNDFSLVKTKSINWDLETSKHCSSIVEGNSNKLEQTSKSKTVFKELPTIKTASHSEEISVIQEDNQDNRKKLVGQNDQRQDDEQFVQEDEDNQPYKSDDQQQEQLKSDKNLQPSSTDPQNDYSGFQQQQQQDSRYLIQNIQAQFQQQNKQAIQQQIHQCSKRLLQNQKRFLHLQMLRNHTQKQYFSHLPKENYLKLKQQISIDENDKEVDKLMKELTKGKEVLVMKFLKIVGFEIQMERCERNVKACKERVGELREMKEKGEWV